MVIKCKYKDGQKLKLLTQKAVDLIWNQLQRQNEELEPEIGDIIEVYPSKEYPDNDSYGITYEGFDADPGWVARAIENTDNFLPVKDKIFDWKKEME